MTASSPIFCAIDRPDLDGALALGRALVGAVGGLKVGLELVTANGPDGVRRMVDLGLPVFLDVKFHDIPNTVAGAVRQAAGLGVAMLTVHISGGAAMLRAALDAAVESDRCPQLLGVTVLTSIDDADLAAQGLSDKVADHVLRLGEIRVEAQVVAFGTRFGPAQRSADHRWHHRGTQQRGDRGAQRDVGDGR